MPDSGGSRRLTRRPMETPGLDVNNTVPQQAQYNYTQPANMYAQPDEQSLPSQQQFYYNNFTSIAPQAAYGHNDFGYGGRGGGSIGNIDKRKSPLYAKLFYKIQL